MRPGGMIAMHRHGFYGFVYVIRGTCTVCGEDGRVELGPGWFALIEANADHGFLNPGREDVEAICVNNYADDMEVIAAESCRADELRAGRGRQAWTDRIKASRSIASHSSNSTARLLRPWPRRTACTGLRGEGSRAAVCRGAPRN
ncbi:MAG: cupin domain-containing protein [Conexivisphaera sp.]